MSRSRRHTPIIGMTTAPSDAAWKAKAARRMRAAARVALSLGEEVTPDKRWSVTNPATSEKDGKQWLGDSKLEALRK